MEKKNDYSKLSYQQLEEKMEEILTKLSQSDLPLDEATTLYEEGKKLSAEMEKRLSDLALKVSDKVDNS